MKLKAVLIVLSLLSSTLLNVMSAQAVVESDEVFEYESVIAGNDFSCALTTSRVVECWGLGEHSQMGRQEFSKINSPGLVYDLKDVIHISLGGRHVCAILTNQNLKCWGDNSFGQVGDGRLLVNPIEERWFPTFVHDHLHTSMVSLGDSHSCSLNLMGEVRCWGRNNLGQLGIGTIDTYRVIPQRVGFSEKVKMIASGADHVCALTESGKIYCWGNNDHGQLGIGQTSNKSAPTLVSSIVGAVKIVAGFDKTCAIFSDASAKCWGDGSAGQLGDGDIVNRSLPSQVSTSVTDKSGKLTPLTGIKEISLGQEHSCLIDKNDSVWCWGRAGNDRLGIGDLSSESSYSLKSYPFYNSGATPVMTSAANVSLGASHSCLTRKDKTIYCWGSNTFQELGVFLPDQESATLFPLKEKIAPVSDLKIEFENDSAIISWTRDLVDIDWTVGGRSSNAQLLATVLLEDKPNKVYCSASLLKSCRIGPLVPNTKYQLSIQVITSISKSRVQTFTFQTSEGLSSAVERESLEAKAKAEAEAKAKAEAESLAIELEAREQKIEVKSPGSQKLSQRVLVIPATSNRGLKVLARSLRTEVCDVTQGIEAVILLKKTGLCSLAFEQPGNNFFNPAEVVRIDFEIVRPPKKVTIICTNGAKRTKITGTNPICPKGFKKA